MCGVHHVTNFAMEVHIELVLNHFILLATECGTHGLLEFFVGADGVLE